MSTKILLIRCLALGAALAVVLLVAAVSPASAASIAMKDGTVLTGEIAGTVLLAAEHSPFFAVIEGKDIVRIDERGVHLKANSVFLQTGMAMTSASYRSIKAVDLLKVVLPAAAKKEPVTEVNSDAAASAFLTGKADGPGVGFVRIGKDRAWFMKVFSSGPGGGRFPVAGELLNNRGKYSITPALRVQTSSTVVSLPVDSLKPFQTKK